MRSGCSRTYIQKMQKETMSSMGPSPGPASSTAGSSGTCRPFGAYGFLSVVKGKKYFLKHVPKPQAAEGRSSDGAA